MKITVSKIVNICMGLALLFVMYLFGAILFGYQLPEFIVPHKTAKEVEQDFYNSRIRIEVKDLMYIAHQRDSLQYELNKCKQWSH